MAGSAAEIGGTMDSCAVWTVMTAIGIAAPIGMAAEVAPSGSSRVNPRSPPDRLKRAKSRRIPAAFSFSLSAGYAGEIDLPCWTSGGRFAKRRPLAKAFRPVSGRIAQLVEQMTLNHRVPGSSPGAPTKLFKDLQLNRREKQPWFTPRLTVLLSFRASAPPPRRAAARVVSVEDRLDVLEAVPGTRRSAGSASGRSSNVSSISLM